ncbi:MAG: hypothetical protein KDA62_05400 [Planctomycetales bacterium]|nr:hypothetical protein [Planctomycetales bacterium]MCA9223193.1 hypothetical protein [Planctomycetales bacterium]MCA9226159.1 hypothetical protein [Planctomycetales bacterium]
MARKVVNRKALREQADAAEAAEKAAGGDAATAPKKKTTRRKKKEAAEVRMKLYWGVYNQSMKRVALFDFNQKKQAEKKAEALSASGKSPHFIQKVKEPVVEE